MEDLLQNVCIVILFILFSNPVYFFGIIFVIVAVVVSNLNDANKKAKKIKSAYSRYSYLRNDMIKKWLKEDSDEVVLDDDYEVK